MKTVQNPTSFFFQQSNNPPTEYKEEIAQFVKQLINLDQCILCKENYDLTNRLPRILIHCGHTFCTSCLKNFYKNARIRCPLCLKLIKNIESIDRLPVNHTIFTKLGQELNKVNKQKGEEQIDIKGALFAQFEASQQPRQQYQQYPPIDPNNPPPSQPNRLDMETGLELCEYHFDRIKHFFCMAHKDSCCRICSEILHSKEDCMVVDLYEIEDMHGFLTEFQQLQQQQSDEQPVQPQKQDKISKKQMMAQQGQQQAPLQQFDQQIMFDQNKMSQQQKELMMQMAMQPQNMKQNFMKENQQMMPPDNQKWAEYGQDLDSDNQYEDVDDDQNSETSPTRSV